MTVSLTTLLNEFFSLSSGPYTWECSREVELIGGHRVEGRCIKKVHDVNGSTPAQGLMACKMTCGKFGTLWPKPTGEVELSKDLVNAFPELYKHLEGTRGPFNKTTKLLHTFNESLLFNESFIV